MKVELIGFVYRLDETESDGRRCQRSFWFEQLKKNEVAIYRVKKGGGRG